MDLHPARAREHRGEQCRIARSQACGALAEEALARGLDAPGATSELRDVQIDLEDPLLAPGELDQDRKAGFETLAKPGLPRPEKQVLRHLLRDGARTTYPAPALAVGEGAVDLPEVEPIVQRERLVLGRDHGYARIRRDCRPVTPLVAKRVAALA